MPPLLLLGEQIIFLQVSSFFEYLVVMCMDPACF